MTYRIWSTREWGPQRLLSDNGTLLKTFESDKIIENDEISFICEYFQDFERATRITSSSTGRKYQISGIGYATQDAKSLQVVAMFDPFATYISIGSQIDGRWSVVPSNGNMDATAYAYNTPTSIALTPTGEPLFYLIVSRNAWDNKDDEGLFLYGGLAINDLDGHVERVAITDGDGKNAACWTVKEMVSKLGKIQTHIATDAILGIYVSPFIPVEYSVSNSVYRFWSAEGSNEYVPIVSDNIGGVEIGVFDFNEDHNPVAKTNNVDSIHFGLEDKISICDANRNDLYQLPYRGGGISTTGGIRLNPVVSGSGITLEVYDNLSPPIIIRMPSIPWAGDSQQEYEIRYKAIDYEKAKKDQELASYRALINIAQSFGSGGSSVANAKLMSGVNAGMAKTPQMANSAAAVGKLNVATAIVGTAVDVGATIADYYVTKDEIWSGFRLNAERNSANLSSAYTQCDGLDTLAIWQFLGQAIYMTKRTPRDPRRVDKEGVPTAEVGTKTLGQGYYQVIPYNLPSTIDEKYLSAISKIFENGVLII